MFLGQMEDDQREAFLALAYKVALADHWVPEPEGDFFEGIKGELGAQTPMRHEWVIGEADISSFADRRTCAIVMLELMALAFSDADFHPHESKLLMEIGKSFGFDGASIDRMATWADRQERVTAVGRELIASGP